MKRQVLLILCTTIICIKGFGQGASIVTDPILTKLATKEAVDREIIKTNGLKALEENIVQTRKLAQQYELNKETIDKLSQVNKKIKQYRNLESSLKRQKNITERTKRLITDFEKRDVFTVKEYAKISDNLNRLVENSQDVIRMFDLVLKPGKTQMNDAERMQMLIELESELSDKQSLTEGSMDYYEDVARQREALSGLDAMGKIMY